MGKANVQVARQAVLYRTVDVYLVQAVHNTVLQAIAQASHATRFLLQFFPGDCAGLAQAHNPRHIQRARPHAALVTTTINDRANLNPWILAPHVQCTHTFWTVELVPRDRRQVDILLVHVYRNFADGLRCIGMEQYTTLTTDFPNLRDGLQHADLIVGRHDSHQDRLVVNRSLQIVKIDKPVFLHWEIGYAVSILLQALAGIEHRLVFCNRCDDVVALLFVHLGHALDGEVVTFGGAGSEYDLLRSGANQPSNALAGLLHRGFGHPPKGMVPAGSVAELFHEEGQHLVQNPGIYRRGGVVIHVYGQFDPLGCRVLLPGHRLHIRVHDCVSCLLYNPELYEY